MAESTPKFALLNNSNYSEWSGDMKAFLMRLGYWGLVSGKEPKPTEGKALVQWELIEQKAAGEIYLAVAQDQKVHIREHLDDPIKMWNELEKVHSSTKAGARFNAYDNLFSIEKKEDESLLDLGVRIENAKAEIAKMRPKGLTVEQLEDELATMAMIRALPGDYSHLSSSLLLKDDLNKTTVLQAFRSDQLHKQRQDQMVNRANSSNASGSNRGGYKGKPWNKEGNKGRSGGHCFVCGDKGHWAAKCPDRKLKGIDKANKAQVEDDVVESAGSASAFSFNGLSYNSSDALYWNTDTGATSHMTPHKSWIRNYKPYRVPVKLADNSVVYSEGVGTVLFRPIIDGKEGRDVEFTRVLHVPYLKTNLLSVLYLTKQKNFHVHIYKDNIQFSLNGSVLFTALVTDRIVGYLNGHTIDATSVVVERVNVSSTSTLPMNLDLWHRRFFHYNVNDISKLSKLELAEGLILTSNHKPDPICEPCLAGKMHADPFPSSDTRATKVLELIHSDVHDVGIKSPSGYRYWITFIDDKSRYKAVSLLKKKSEAFAAFKDFKAWAENSTGLKIKILRHDKGGEYISGAFENYLKDNGIEVQKTTRNRPQQNGVAERANRTMEGMLLCAMFEAGMAKTFWAECLAALVHVWNRCPTTAVPNSTPYEIWYKKKPKVDHLRVWGCVAYVHIQKDKREKLGWHSEKCIFIGYPTGTKGWRFWNPGTKKVVISERADFDERYTYKSWKSVKDQKQIKAIVPKEPDNSQIQLGPTLPDDDDSDSDDSVPPPLPEQEDSSSEDDNGDAGNGNNNDDRHSPSPEPADNRPIALRKPVRNCQPPGEYWKVKPTAQAPVPQPQQFEAGPYRDPTPAYDEEQSDSDNEDDDQDDEYANRTHLDILPKTYKQAVSTLEFLQWQEAMHEEMNAHLINRTWDIVDLPPGKKAIGSKWVYTLKHLADGSIERFKARIVALGFSQRPGFDYLETYASVMRFSTLRTILALAAIHDMELRTVDISHAFINSDIDAEIYMVQPEGFRIGGPEKVCRLNKSLYGLKQSPRLWSEKLTSVLEQMGFKKLVSDPSVYIFERDNIKVIVPVWVDDITLASKDASAIERFVEELKKHFKLRDLGNTTYLLGVEIIRDRAKRKLWFSSRQYILEKLKEYGMSDCKPVGTPLNPNVVLSREQCPKTPEEQEEMKNIPYISAVGSLLFLAMVARPDIAFAASVLARFNFNPGPIHWIAVKHLFRYLQGTVDLMLCYEPQYDMDDLIDAFCDSDLGGNRDNGKSTTGYMIKIGSAVVSWCSKLQPVVTLSSTEAEFVAANAAGKEICAMRSLLSEMGYQVSSPSTMWVDNQSAITVAKNPEHHGRMKHLDRAYFWLREKVNHKVMMPTYLASEDNAADMLTKPLGKPKVEKFREMMGLVMRKSGPS